MRIRVKFHFYLILVILYGTNVQGQSLQKRFSGEKRFSWLSTNDHDRYFEIVVNVKSLNQETIQVPENLKGIFALEEKAQEELIRQIAAKSGDAKQLLEKLREPLELKKDKKQSVLDDYYRIIPATFKKTFAVYVKRVLAGEKVDDGKTISFKNDLADKLDNLKLLITMNPTSPLKFLTWDKLKNADTTLNLGNISSISNFGVSLNGTLGTKNTISTEANTNSKTIDYDEETVKEISKITQNIENGKNSKVSTVNDVSAGVSGGLNYTNNRTTARQFWDRTAIFSGYYEPQRIYIDLMRVDGVELVGNTYVTVDCKVNVETDVVRFIKFKKLSDELEVKHPDSIAHYFYFVAYPNVTQPIVGYLNYGFLFRNVIGGSKFYPEYKQRIKYLYGSTLNEEGNNQPYYQQQQQQSFAPLSSNTNTKQFTIVETDEFKPKRFVIRLAPNVHVALAGETEAINFETSKEAMSFLTWLKIQSSVASNVGRLNAKFIAFGAAGGASLSSLINNPAVRIIEQ